MINSERDSFLLLVIHPAGYFTGKKHQARSEEEYNDGKEMLK
jgi:hypothetical protein